MSAERFLTAEEQISIIEALRKSSTPVPMADRNAIIEECARAVENFGEMVLVPRDILAAHLRALKDK